METSNYIGMLKSKNRAAAYVAMRQALCYYLDENNVPCNIIKKVLGIPKSSLYFSIGKAKDMLDTGDKIMQAAYDEVYKHKIRIVPCTAKGDILSQHIGYKMTIDNEIY